ncbi:MAG: uncharacterized protein JWO36_1019, partial [Myxococcales bacterium]|nr:uncharacterized protein [Myxococcales bacterium]
PTGDLPHGVWTSGDEKHVYVGLENQDAVSAIDTSTNKVIATVAVGQQPQALVYVPDAVPSGPGTDNLLPLGEAGQVSHLRLAALEPTSAASATVSVNALGPLDLLQIAATGLVPGGSYTLWLVTSRTPPFRSKEPLVTFKANLAGAQIAQTIGPLRRVLTAAPDQGGTEQRFLLVTEVGHDAAVLVQSEAPPP